VPREHAIPEPHEIGRNGIWRERDNDGQRLFGSESAAISVKAGHCHGTITTAQGSLNGPDLANRGVFYFLF
jgi:hypothetical protein